MLAIYSVWSDKTPPPPCGSGLARESGVSGTSMSTDPPSSRASPLPQGDIRVCPGSGSNVQSTAAIDAR
ncbi:hypothetical protein C3E97_007640 [Pseudomonas sp. MWU12-2115]|nr:hypothetical protein C3E97_007640 [Pseudomonas sp. MWU12-2115]